MREGDTKFEQVGESKLCALWVVHVRVCVLFYAHHSSAIVSSLYQQDNCACE